MDFPLPRFSSTEPAPKHTSSSPPSVALSCSDVVAERWGDRTRIHGVDVGKGTLVGNLRKHCVFLNTIHGVYKQNKHTWGPQYMFFFKKKTFLKGFELRWTKLHPNVADFIPSYTLQSEHGNSKGAGNLQWLWNMIVSLVHGLSHAITLYNI